MSKYQITVEWPTGKPTVEVSGLGVFPNHETTELTDEQVENWFNRVGANPLAQFPEGITVTEVTPAPKVTSTTKKKDQASPKEEEAEPVAKEEEAPADKAAPEEPKGDA